MNEVADIFKSHIGTCIPLLNAEKGDSLLASFDPSSDYFLYRLPNSDTLPNRDNFFVQGYRPQVISAIQGGTGIRYFIFVECFVSLVGDDKADIRRERYLRIIQHIIQDEVPRTFGNRNIEISDYYVGETDTENELDNLYLVGGMEFGINLA